MNDKEVIEGIDLYNQTSTGDVSKSINTGTDSDHVPCVLSASHTTFFQNVNENVSGTQSATDYKDAPMVAYPEAKEDVHYIVRRLTPLECERLQGYPDGWTDIGEWTDDKGKVHKLADSNRYKALGNSIALPSWRWVMKRMAAQYERPATLASLFDGIGGFPLIWESINGPGTCLWASEIEDFPMAVTKERFK